MKEYLRRGRAGFFIGATVSYITVLLSGYGQESITIDMRIILIHFLLTAFLGMHLVGCTVFFDQEKWSLLKQTMMHFMGMIPALPIAYILGWMPHSLVGVLVYISIFVLAYVIFWVIFYNYWKKEVELLNKQVQDLQKGLSV